MRVFLAGATGVLGVRLLPLLVAAGHQVAGTTRAVERAAGIAAAGGVPVVVDVYDRAALTDAVVGFRPDLVMHQLTDLPDDPAQIPARCRRQRPHPHGGHREPDRGRHRGRRAALPGAEHRLDAARSR
ncbi:NAD-dependent epimerase/dehydratase family protein [Nocardia farcinica]|uniref:NAD-dependent epimerase/dehydratase family protein n=1 Tax=Nocardia farcinica TaxID=37329 RepID=UPI002804D7BB|nr:NAD-dependent epimerase/dehydratase family protein [Nocardia farcinica]